MDDRVEAEWIEGLATAVGGAVTGWLTDHGKAEFERQGEDLGRHMASVVGTIVGVAAQLTQTMRAEPGVTMSKDQFVTLARSMFKRAARAAVPR